MPLLTIAVMLALHVPSPQLQQRDIRAWYQAYEEGRLAVGKNDAAAIASLDSAKRGGPKPGRNVNTYGDTFIAFNPDYYLGLAYLNLKRFADADAAFKRVQQAQLIGPKDRDNATFTAQATKATFELELDTAEKTLAVKQFDLALQAARQASKIRGISAADAGRASDLEKRILTAMAVPSPTPITPAYSPTPDRTPTSSTTISATELMGMTLFFKGDYAGAGAELRTVSEGKSPTARAYFYLACAKVGLVLTGQADGQMLQDAKALFVTARGDSSMFRADRQYISPRVLQLLEGKQ